MEIQKTWFYVELSESQNKYLYLDKLIIQIEETKLKQKDSYKESKRCVIHKEQDEWAGEAEEGF